MENETNEVLRKYMADTGVRSVQKVETDFDRVAQMLPSRDLTSGLSEALRSEQTPAFEELVGQSFEHGDARQRVAVLNRLLDAASPEVVRRLQQDGVISAPADDGARPPLITSEQAERLNPEQVQEIAQVAQQEDPGVIDRISNCLAEDPSLARSLGGATLNVALEKIAQQR